MPGHRNLEEYLTAYLAGAGLRSDPKGPLFRTIGRGTGKLTRTVLPQANAYAMIGRRASALALRRSSAITASALRESPRTLRTRKGRGDGEPCVNAHDAALRSPAR
jgi:hypothetical protein